jgi:DNA segregation ATPase FtsK/SpoIIIE, S-DNA-T family
MADSDDLVCPESKITPEISRSPALDMPITAVIIDQVLVFLENPAKQAVGARQTIGAYIAEPLTYLAKKGPAAGIIVILATQRPDSKTIPSALRAVLGSRFALRVMDWRDSNIILGEQMNSLATTRRSYCHPTRASASCGPTARPTPERTCSR